MSTRSVTLTGLLIAAGIAAGVIFHSFGIGGKVALPLHYPPLLAGLLLGWRAGFGVGVIVPLLSSLITGIPPLLPSAVLMTFELAVYGSTAGLLRKRLGIYPALISALLLGRFAWGIAFWLLTPLFGLEISVVTAFIAAMITGIPGIAAQLLLIPILINRIEKLYGMHRPGT
jgi:hypothetical protein